MTHPSTERETSVVVPVDCDRLRADKVLPRFLPQFSRTRIQRLFDTGLVWSDAEVLSKSSKVAVGDTITFTLPPNEPSALEPVRIPLQIIYEDEAVIVVDKQPGMIVHPGNATESNTLVHALLYHCGESLRGIGGVKRPGIVHRLDKETSGLLAVAKTEASLVSLGEQFSRRTVEKEYFAIVRGLPELKSGVVEAPIGRHPTARIKMAVTLNGRPARTEWKFERACGIAFSLLRIRIHTGRTHQIRVHLSHIRHPVAGDRLYGFRPLPDDPFQPLRVLLHAFRLAFFHPTTRARMQFEAKIPDDFILRPQ